MHRTIIAVDIEGFGVPSRTMPHQLGTRAGLYKVVEEAFDAARVPWDRCRTEDRGDAVFILVPPDIPKAPLVEVVPEALAHAVRAHNHTSHQQQRVRLRMAIHAGEVAFDDHGVTSTAVTTTFRLLDAPPVKQALADSPGVVALIVSRWVFNEVVRHSTVLDPTTFRPIPVAVKETHDTAWIALPDQPYPADPTVLEQRDDRTRHRTPAPAPPVDEHLRLLARVSWNQWTAAANARGCAFAGLAFLVAAGMLAWRTWPGTQPGQFDPVGAGIAMASLVVSVVAAGLAVRAQRQVDTNVREAAERLAVAVGDVEAEARQQLLGGDNRTIDVEFVFWPAAAHNASRAAAKGTLEQVVGYYRALRPRRMVITGAAGSGKTVLAIELILGLLKDRAEDPVPVRMPAAMLDTSRPTESAVRDWLVEHLTRTYRLPRAAARELVAARMVLPVLDGLDEMDAEVEPGYASRAARTIRACNAYLDGTGHAGMVLTCRTGQYQALERSREWVRDAAHIQIRPVGLPKARTFLVRKVIDEGRWQPVLAVMKRTGNRLLARALSTPWRLTLAVIVYDERDPDTGTYLRDPAELTSPALDTEDKIRDHLLSLLIPTLTTVHHGPHPGHRVHRWLKTLACYLNSNTASTTRPGRRVAGRELSETDLILHELWPLVGTRLPRVIPALVPAVGSSVFAVYLLTHVPTGRSPQQIIVASVIVSALASIYWRCRTPWPSPSKFDLQQILTRAGQRQLLGGLPVGLAVGLAMGLAFGPAVGLTIGLAFGFAFGLTDGLTGLDYSPVGPQEAVRSSITAGLAIGLTFGLPIGLAIGLTAGLPFGPLAELTAGLAFGLPVGFTFGPLAGLADGLTVGLTIALMDALTDGLTAGLMVGLAAGLIVGSRSGLVGSRYLALLLCTRRWNNQHLPWRLGEFLRWCYDAGLVRIAGTGYQFRHRELQEYLARNPTP